MFVTGRAETDALQLRKRAFLRHVRTLMRANFLMSTDTSSRNHAAVPLRSAPALHCIYTGHGCFMRRKQARTHKAQNTGYGA